MLKRLPPATTHIIACQVLRAELADRLPPAMGVTEIEAFLHRTPTALTGAIQFAIDRLPVHIKTVIIAYGLCSKAVVGMKARNHTLIIPKIDDCLGLLFGSRPAYTGYLNRYPGSYFLSRGWLEAGINMLTDYTDHERRFGVQKARRIHEQMFAHYNRVVFIESGGDSKPYTARAKEIATFCGWPLVTVKGSDTLLRRLLDGPYDTEQFVITPPGATVGLADFLPEAWPERPSQP